MIDFHVAQLLQEPQGTTRRYQFEAPPELYGDLPLAAPVRGEVVLTNVGRSILADASWETTVHDECARCLNEATQPLRGRLQEEFVPTLDVRTGSSLSQDPDDEAFPIDEQHVLYLDEALRQHIVMELPQQLLCRPDCAGLCPDCGQDLNEAACACAPASADSPFHALSTLLQGEEVDGARR